MLKKEKIKIILDKLNEYYPSEDVCYLNYSKDYELLFATILSAQCTDERVNIVTKDLFEKYPSLEAFASADLNTLCLDVKPTGFYRNKGAHLKNAATRLLDHYKGVLPNEVEELTTLSGVGRKTANVVRCHIFGLPSVVVDTHVKRISKKLGLTKLDDPVKIEFELMKILPKESWVRYNHQLIAHGRVICKAPTPKCEQCFLTEVCSHYQKANKKKG